METPKTLQQAIIHFSKPENCNEFMIQARFPDGVVRCPQCGSDNVFYLENARLYKCRTKHPKQKFSLKVGTIFEDSPLGLDKWLVAIWLIANAKNGISSYEIHRALGVTQKSAWFMLHRIRLAMQNGSQNGSLDKLSDHVEVDETFIARWLRKRDGEWDMVSFRAKGFTVLDSDMTLRESIDRLRAVPAKWKELDDPLGELKKIRHGT